MEDQLKPNSPEEAKEYFKKKLAFTLGPVELDYYRKNQKGGFNIIDVRAAADYAEGHVPGAISLPDDQWASLKGLSKDKVNVVYCYTQQCHLAAKAAAFFAARGYPVKELEGGFGVYRENEFEIEKGSPSESKKPAA